MAERAPLVAPGSLCARACAKYGPAGGIMRYLGFVVAGAIEAMAKIDAERPLALDDRKVEVKAPTHSWVSTGEDDAGPVRPVDLD